MKLSALASCAFALLSVTDAHAFSFTPRDFGKLANDRAGLAGVPFRMYLAGCEHSDKLGGNACAYRISPDVALAVIAPDGSDRASTIMLTMTGHKDFAAFGSATGILLSVCSPNTTDDERNATAHKIVGDIAAQTGNSAPAETTLDGTSYSVVQRPEFGIVIRAEDKSGD